LPSVRFWAWFGAKVGPNWFNNSVSRCQLWRLILESISLMIRLIFSIFVLFSSPVWGDETEHTISVTGVGSITTTPDIARVSVGVTADARTAREALTRNSEAMQEVLETLTEQGVAQTDIQTTSLLLFPSFENRTPGKPPTVVGFRAQNMVAVKIRDLASLGQVLDQVSEAGGNLIQSIQFDRDDTGQLIDEARKAAVLDAREKAEIYAETAGISVGKVISISESGSRNPQPQMMARAGIESMSTSVPVAQGELELSASVNMVFLIE